MLLIAAFAIYAILAKKVYITRSFVLSGDNARRFGISLLMLLLPMVIAINFVMRLMPSVVMEDPIVSRLIGVAILGACALGIATIFRDRPAPEGGGTA